MAAALPATADIFRIESAVDAEAKESDHDHDHHHHHGEHDHHHHHDHDHKHEHHNGHHHAHDHTHDPGVSSISIVCEGVLYLEKASMWLGTLLIEQSDYIYRMKGFYLLRAWMRDLCFRPGVDVFLVYG